MTSVYQLYKVISRRLYGIQLTIRLYTKADFSCRWITRKWNHCIFILFSSFILITETNINAQTTRKVLFLGNSYTGVNNLPQIVHDVALSVGDNLVFDSYTPGGYYLIDHSLDANSRNKIMAGGWNYVVIQGQSEEPITLSSQFTNGGIALYNLIKQHNPCAVTMPYMTWGRKNGDTGLCPNFPLLCTYQGMDTTIRKRYLNLTTTINGEVSPVSVVWNYLRQNHPNIELYQADESHPSAAGSYVAACCFYVSIFKKDPALITFNFGLNAVDALIIKNAVKTQVFDKLQSWDFKKLPTSDFQYQIGSGINQVIFSPITLGIKQTYFWDFGDGNTTSIFYPTHSYLTNGTYTVRLTTTNCDLQGIHTSTTDTVIQFCSHTPTIYISRPQLCMFDTLWTQPADSYQWFVYGRPIPETRQYLPNYYRYGITGFTVIATSNGCSELSKSFTQTAPGTGYYFDVIGNPCAGDTVAFAVLHANGFLSGLEKIQWFKNNSLLPLMTNQDTLLITGSGKYECKVVNPSSNCPLDTTWYSIVYDCGPPIDTPGGNQESFWTVYPNPASKTITIKFKDLVIKDQIQIYSAMGHLIKVKEVSGANTLDLGIADLLNGLYFIRLRNYKHPALKFIKH